MANRMGVTALAVNKWENGKLREGFKDEETYGFLKGGTFENDAVLCAMEQYIGREVTRAPYPGIMGAIGAALITKERFDEKKGKNTFIGLDAMDDFSYAQEANAPCPFCTNHCKRTIVTFSNGKTWVANNRCERGEVLGNPKDEKVRRQVKEKQQKKEEVPNLFKFREKLLFQEYEYTQVEQDKGITIGMTTETGITS